MKKLFKLLLASAMVFSLAACSSDDDDDTKEEDEEDVVEDVIVVEEEEDWRDELTGKTGTFTMLYDGEERDVIVQVANETTLNFYYDQDEEERFASITVYAGSMDEDDVLDTLEFTENGAIPYDDITFGIYAVNDEYIYCEYDYSVDDGCYEITSFNTNEGIPSSTYQGYWSLNADLNQDSLSIDYEGNWVIIPNDGSGNYQKGFAYADTSTIDLYDMSGGWVGFMYMADDTWLIVSLNDETYYYARQENSTYGQ